MKEKTTSYNVYGTLPDKTNIAITYEFQKLPSKGDLIEVASLLPSDEQYDYRRKVKFDDSPAAKQHHFVQVKEIIWANSQSEFNEGNIENTVPEHALVPIIYVKTLQD